MAHDAPTLAQCPRCGSGLVVHGTTQWRCDCCDTEETLPTAHCLRCGSVFVWAFTLPARRWRWLFLRTTSPCDGG